MKWGTFADLFRGIAWKRLTSHEVDPRVSNGHEFQGVAKLKELLGTEGKRRFPTTYLMLADDDGSIEAIHSVASWYDSRAEDPDRAAEWRLYYSAKARRIQSVMSAGDLVVIALTTTDELVVMLARQGTAKEAQLRVLFDLGYEEDTAARVRRFERVAEISFLAAAILEEIGLAAPTPDWSGDGAIVHRLAADLGARFPTALPPGREVSGFIHAAITDVDPVNDPDGTLVRWIEAEEAVFHLWEDGLIARRLERGFQLEAGAQDVQGFRDFSMTIRQSRVSRAGGALQIHAARIMTAYGIPFTAQGVTEHGERPDFVFPGIEAYRDSNFPEDRLRMLAAKFTAKERWRQVLNEAARIRRKHLLTLDVAISQSQLAAMHAAKLQPVIPEGYRASYPVASQALSISLGTLLVELTHA